MFFNFLQMQYYQSVLISPTSEVYDVRCTTIVLQMTNRLFDKHLLPNKFTWSGRSPLGERIAFKKFVNIIKLIHAVLLVFVPSAKLADVEALLNKKVLKHAVARAKGTDTRESTGRVFAKKVKKAAVNEAGNASGSQSQSGDKSTDDNDLDTGGGIFVKQPNRRRKRDQILFSSDDSDEESVQLSERIAKKHTK